MGDMKHILLATDGSTGARHAFHSAVALAVALKGRLTLLTVVEHSAISQEEQSEPHDLAGDCEEFRRQALEAGIRQVKVVVESGLAYSRILNAASRECADLIVIGARGLGGHDSPLGDTVTQVAKFATCPILIVR